MATRVEGKYSSVAMKSSVRKEVQKELIRTGVNPAGKAGGRKVKKEVNDRIANGLRFELSIANAIKDTKAGDVAGAIAAHKISHVIYDKEE